MTDPAPARSKISIALFDYLFGQFLPASGAVLRRRFIRIGKALAFLILLWLVLFAGAWIWEWRDQSTVESRWYRAPTSPDAGLVVLVHGWRTRPSHMEGAAKVIAEMGEFREYGIFLWDYESNLFSNKDPAGLSADLSIKIEELRRGARNDVVLVGHSIGGLLVRRAYLNGLDENKEWAKRVSRIVLFAAPNRGAESVSHSASLQALDMLVASFGAGKLIRAAYRGAPFVVDLRIDWIQRFQKLDRPPIVAQLVGRRDGIVNSGDSVDVLQFPNAISRDLPNSTHASIVKPEESGPYLQEVLRAKQGDPKPKEPTSGGTPVKLLLVHGIRDYGERFEEIRTAANSIAVQRQIALRARPIRYKYFSALQFINPLSRERKVFEFADLYTDMMATPPVDAPIYFVGHSFGTYLMAKSLDRYKSMKFERAYLAGSVLSEDFFSRRQDFLGSRIRYLRNDIATEDWPVGILCSALGSLSLAEDVGTGGFHGFTAVNADSDSFEQVKFFDGGHGRALEEENRPTIASWLLQGPGFPYDTTSARNALLESKTVVNVRSEAWNFASRAAPGIFVLLVALILYLLLVGRRPWFALGEILVIMWMLNIL